MTDNGVPGRDRKLKPVNGLVNGAQPILQQKITPGTARFCPPIVGKGKLTTGIRTGRPPKTELVREKHPGAALQQGFGVDVGLRKEPDGTGPVVPEGAAEFNVPVDVVELSGKVPIEPVFVTDARLAKGSEGANGPEGYAQVMLHKVGFPQEADIVEFESGGPPCETRFELQVPVAGFPELDISTGTGEGGSGGVDGQVSGIFALEEMRERQLGTHQSFFRALDVAHDQVGSGVPGPVPPLMKKIDACGVGGPVQESRLLAISPDHRGKNAADKGIPLIEVLLNAAHKIIGLWLQEVLSGVLAVGDFSIFGCRHTFQDPDREAVLGFPTQLGGAQYGGLVGLIHQFAGQGSEIPLRLAADPPGIEQVIGAVQAANTGRRKAIVEDVLIFDEERALLLKKQLESIQGNGGRIGLYLSEVRVDGEIYGEVVRQTNFAVQAKVALYGIAFGGIGIQSPWQRT